MIRVQLTRGQVALIDDEDADLCAYKWQAMPKKDCTGGYYAFRQRAKADGEGAMTIYMHRAVMAAKPGEIVDHIDGDGLNNTRANLRVGDLSLNAINRHYTSSTGFRGVHRAGTGFRAQASRAGRTHRGRRRETALEAALDYDEIATRIFGAFAILNFPRAA